MNPSAETPVVLLIFANSRFGDGSRFLRNLVGERREIRAALSRPESEGICRVEWEQNTTRRQLFDLLDSHQERIVGVHFGGHADPRGLVFEDDAGRPSAGLIDGIAQRLERLPLLRWVFLNGCGTAAHVEALHRRVQVPLVATETAIRDDVAVEMARRFYHGLAHGQCIRDAFDNAQSAVRTSHSDPAAVVRGPGEDALRLLRPGGESSRWPWILVVPAHDPASAERCLYDSRATQGLARIGPLRDATIESWPPRTPSGNWMTVDDEPDDEATDDGEWRPDSGLEFGAIGHGSTDLTLEGRGRSTLPGTVPGVADEQHLPPVDIEIDQPTAEHPTDAHPTAEQLTAEQLTAEQLTDAHPTAEQLTAERSRDGDAGRLGARVSVDAPEQTAELSRVDLELVPPAEPPTRIFARGTIELSRADVELLPAAEPPTRILTRGTIELSRSDLEPIGAGEPDGVTTELSRDDIEWVGEAADDTTEQTRPDLDRANRRNGDPLDAIGTVELSRSDIELFDPPPDASRMDHAVIISRKSILGAQAETDDGDEMTFEGESTAIDPFGDTQG